VQKASSVSQLGASTFPLSQGGGLFPFFFLSLPSLKRGCSLPFQLLMTLSPPEHGWMHFLPLRRSPPPRDFRRIEAILVKRVFVSSLVSHSPLFFSPSGSQNSWSSPFPCEFPPCYRERSRFMRSTVPPSFSSPPGRRMSFPPLFLFEASVDVSIPLKGIKNMFLSFSYTRKDERH